MKGRYTEASHTSWPIPSGTRRPDLVDRSPITNEENAWILPLRGNEPNPSVLHELVFRPRPASQTMSENPPTLWPLGNHSHRSPPRKSNVELSAVPRDQHARGREESSMVCSGEYLGGNPKGPPTQRVEPEGEGQLRWVGGFSSHASLLLLLCDSLV